MLFFRDYLEEALGDIWLDISTLNLNKEMFGLPAFENGQKPLALVRRALQTSTARDPQVLDFFAGSGTTAHAALSLRQEGRRATFVVVESESYFDTVLIRRVARAMEHTAAEGRDGALGGPGVAKVLRLERFEDSLVGLELSDATEPPRLDKPLAYVIQDRSGVMLDTQRLEHPFDYTLAVHGEEGVVDHPVDLAETFNVFAGVSVDRLRWDEHAGRQYQLVSGTQGGSPVLVVWRDVDGLDPAAELEFLEERAPILTGRDLGEFEKVWHNADSVIPNGASLDAEFHRLMFEPEPGLS
jgi:adenine-specific DNA-methyltransferase